MKSLTGLTAALLLATTPLAHAQLPAQVGETPVPSLAPMVKRVSPAVVNIATRGTVQEQNPLLNDPFFRRFFDVPNTPRQRQFQSAGSGVIVDAKQGYIVTNAHVIENATEITVTLLDNRTDTGQPARAVAYEIDESAGTATLLWQIDAPQGVSSLGLGSNRLAADGSVLVDWGAGVQPMFEEFDDQLDAVMRITQVDGGQAYRIVKEQPSAFSASTLRATAGGFAESP